MPEGRSYKEKGKKAKQERRRGFCATRGWREHKQLDGDGGWHFLFILGAGTWDICRSLTCWTLNHEPRGIFGSECRRVTMAGAERARAPWWQGNAASPLSKRQHTGRSAL